MKSGQRQALLCSRLRSKRQCRRPLRATHNSHQVPILVSPEFPEHVQLLEAWMRSCKPEELFDKEGRLLPELAALAPKGERRMGANLHANGGLLLRELQLPDFREHALQITAPGAIQGQDTRVLGQFLRDVARLNRDARNFRIFGPDETVSNLLGAVFEVTSRQWDAQTLDNDEFLSADGQVLDSMLSEHQCQGWLEGYLLTGRRGLFNSGTACSAEITNGHHEGSLDAQGVAQFGGIPCGNCSFTFVTFYDDVRKALTPT